MDEPKTKKDETSLREEYRGKSESFLNETGYKRIVNAMAESVWIGDEHERTVYANPNFCHLLGYELDEMLGKKSYDFWDEASVRTVQENNSLRKKGDASKYEWVLRAKDGTLIPVFLSGIPLENGGTVGIMTDLREIQSIKDQAEKFKELSQMKDDFISMVGHELRTPLTGIRGYASLVLDGDGGEIPPKAREYVEAVFREAGNLASIVNDMIDVVKFESRKIHMEMQEFPPFPVGEETVSDMKFFAEEKGVNLRFESSVGKETLIMADPKRLKQVFVNFITNAVKFTPSGWDVVLRISTCDGDVLFEVQDTGIGIPKDRLETIFEKFGQVENYLQKSAGGTGLGLYICQNIVERFDSSISIKSEEGKGSTFFFRLPISSSVA